MVEYQCPHCRHSMTAVPKDARYALVCPSCSKFFRAEEAQRGAEAPPVNGRPLAEVPASPAVASDVGVSSHIPPSRTPKTRATLLSAYAGPIVAVVATILMAVVGWAALGGSPGGKSADRARMDTATTETPPVDAQAGELEKQILKSTRPPTRAEKNIVRVWLKENLGDPQWEEIKWYPVAPVRERTRRQLAEARQKNDLDEIKVCEAALQRPEEFLCGLKLRTKTGFGGSVVTLFVFSIENGKATTNLLDVPTYDERWYAMFVMAPADR